MKKIAIVLIILSASVSCNKEKWFGGDNYISEGFETYAHVDSMFSYEDIRWSYHQNTHEGNYIAFDTTIVHSGNRSLKFFGAAHPGEVSKSSIAKQEMAFFDGDVVRVSAWYYIASAPSTGWLFLFDFEEQTAIGAGPGLRIADTQESGLVLEHKFYNDDFYQPASGFIALPRNQWVNITMEVKLSQKKKGYVKIWQDNQLIIEGYDRKTLPKDFLYSQQGTKGMYQSIEFGVTANSSSTDVIMYVDDIEVKKVN